MTSSSCRARSTACSMLLFAMLAGTSLQPGPMAAVSRAWVLRSRGDFENMKMDGVALSPDGDVSLSGKATVLADAAQPNLWCLARDPSGVLYAGSGNDGRILRVRPESGSHAEVIFDAQHLGVQAIAFDSRGRLYAATSPRGGVYLISPEGMSVLIFDPADHYIWALAFDAKDRLYVATGRKGKVYRVDSLAPGSAATIVLDGREDNIRSLAVGSDDAIYAGSDQNGIVYRIAANGESSVVYDTPMREIAALAVVPGPKGTDLIYAAALAPVQRQGRGAGQAPAPGVTRIRVTAEEGNGEGEGQPEEGGERQGNQSRAEGRQAAQESLHGAIFRISQSGQARRIWESNEMLPLSLALMGSTPARLLVGTGNAGRILAVDESGETTSLATVSGQQVSALLTGKDGSIFATTCNLGQIHRLALDGDSSGTLTSNAHDAGITASWGALSWSGDTPRGSSIAIQVRTGDTEDPDDSWSEWTEQLVNQERSLIDRPRSRFLQWKATLSRKGDGAVPTLRGLTISYLQDNVPPEVTSVEVLGPGVVMAAGGGPERGSEVPGENEGAGAAARRAQAQPRRAFERGRRSVVWKSEDANDDALAFDVYFRAEDETLWKPMERGIDREFYSWDTSTMPDGVYRLKVEGSDAPSNPEGFALTGSRVSTPFDVDNTPPVISPLRPRLAGRDAAMDFTVADTFSLVGEVDYSVDAGEWRPLPPEGRIADDLKESYTLKVGSLDPGEHTVTVRARDRAGNTTAGRAVVRIE